MDNQQPVYLEDCEIKKAKRGNSMEILLKSSTTIHKSPKKFDTTVFNFQEDLTLDFLESKDVYDKVSVRVKVLQLLDTVTTPIGKKIQEIIISDGTATSKVTLWENYVGRLEIGKSYYLRHFNVQEYHSKKFLSTPKEGAIIEEIDDLPCSVEAESVTVDDDKNIANPCIVGVSKLDRYKLCLRCKARVEPGCSNLGRCSKPDCEMLQRYDVCPDYVSAQLLFSCGSDATILSLFAHNKVLLEMAGVANTEITEELLLSLPSFAIIKYNNNVITSFTK